jgi:predicted amidophosphoribosyltransferase
MTVRKFFGMLLDLVLPLSTEAAIARSLDSTTLQKLVNPLEQPLPWVTSLFPYHDTRVRALVRAIKYRGEKAPLPILGAVAAEEILAIISDKRALEGWSDILFVPIPSPPKRLRNRGYNQAERIALGILPFLHGAARYAPDVLGREERESQVRVPREKRASNIKGAFFVLRPEVVAGTQIILLDDVTESGSTLIDARRALRAAGASDVIAVAIAH